MPGYDNNQEIANNCMILYCYWPNKEKIIKKLKFCHNEREIHTKYITGWNCSCLDIIDYLYKKEYEYHKSKFRLKRFIYKLRN